MVDAFLESVTVRRTDVSSSINLKWFTQFALKKAILDNEFKAFFQPKFNLVTGAVDSLEALARWDNPNYGLLSPADFLPLLNSFYLMDDLFFALFEQGLMVWQEVLATGRQLNLAFNLQAEQFSNPQLVAGISGLIERYQVPASCLTFE